MFFLLSLKLLIFICCFKFLRAQILQQLWYVFAVQTCCSFISFFFGRVACMTMAQKESFTLPTVLVTPVIAACSASLWAFKLKSVQQSRSILYLLDFVGELFLLSKADQFKVEFLD